MENRPRFKIIYIKRKLSQALNYITREEWEYIKQLNRRISELESEASSLGKKNKRRIEIWKEISDLKSEISKFGDFFVEDSPLDRFIKSSRGLDVFEFSSFRGFTYKELIKIHPV